MGNIGDTISSGSIPAVGTSGTTYASQINLFLTEVKARLEAKMPKASLAPGALDMDGYAVQNASYVGLADAGGAPTTPDNSLQMFDGELYWVSAAGVVQITESGDLNAAGIGGITGDYGSPNPAQFRFVDADQEYYAYDNFAGGAWAYLWALGLDLAKNSTSSTRIRVKAPSTLASSFSLTLPDVPVAPAWLQMDAAGAVTASSNLARTVAIHAGNAIPSNAAGHTFLNGIWSLAATVGALLYPITIEVGRTITGYTLYLNKLSDATNTITVKLFYQSGTSGFTEIVAFTTSNAANAPGQITLSASGQTRVVAANEYFILSVSQSDSTPSATDTSGQLALTIL